MGPELSNKYNEWKVGIVHVLLNEHRKYMVGQALMYMKHMHMVCSKYHIRHDLDLDQKVYDNAYSTHLIHEALDGNRRMAIPVIG